VEIGEAGKKLGADTGAVARRELTVTWPDCGRLWRSLGDAGDDAIECLVPSCSAEFITAPIANERMEHSSGIADDFSRRLPSDAKETTAIRIGFVAFDTYELASAHLGQHAAQRRMTVHRTHRADDS